jgi:hypothetical protein
MAVGELLAAPALPGNPVAGSNFTYPPAFCIGQIW